MSQKNAPANTTTATAIIAKATHGKPLLGCGGLPLGVCGGSYGFNGQSPDLNRTSSTEVRLHSLLFIHQSDLLGSILPKSLGEIFRRKLFGQLVLEHFQGIGNAILIL